jgi:hypothetical protein
MNLGDVYILSVNVTHHLLTVNNRLIIVMSLGYTVDLCDAFVVTVGCSSDKMDIDVREIKLVKVK